MASNGAGFEEHATARRYWALAWSPTGDGLLVQGELGTERASGGSGIFLASLDGTELSQLTPAGIAMRTGPPRERLRSLRQMILRAIPFARTST